MSLRTFSVSPAARWVLLAALLFTGCVPASQNEVVIYTALDKEFSEPILTQFEHDTGIRVRAKYDLESNKTVGLANAILQKQGDPPCDLFWNNEVLHTERLRRAGLLQPFDFSDQAIYPPETRGPNRQWQGFAARARVLIVNTKLLPDPEKWPTSVFDLADPQWKGKCTIARPLFGTSATHAAVLFHELGRARAEEFFRQVHDVAAIQGGNKQVAVRVGEGEFAFGLTDTDDAIIERDAGRPVAIIFPDQAEQQLGAVMIPNTLAAVRQADGLSAPTQRLIDYLLSPEVEARLASGASAQFPLNLNDQSPHHLDWRGKKFMSCDFAAAAEEWDDVVRLLESIFPL